VGFAHPVNMLDESLTIVVPMMGQSYRVLIGKGLLKDAPEFILHGRCVIGACFTASFFSCHFWFVPV